jgi:hypothetical protein
MSNVNWRHKDDLDLTSEDIDAMIAEGEAVEVCGPALPGNGVLIKAAPTYGAVTAWARPKAPRVKGQLVARHAPPLNV